MRIKQQLVRIWKRPTKDGGSFTYYLRYVDLEGKRRCESLHHSDSKKAEKQRTTKEKELRMGFCPSGSMRLSEFKEDYLRRTGEQIRESTKTDYMGAFDDFIKIVGDIDFQAVDLTHGEKFRQICLDQGNSKSTVAKKINEVRMIFQSAVHRNQLDENPLKNLKTPKIPTNMKIRIYSEDECDRFLHAAPDIQKEHILEWDLLITLALTTGLRKSELLNMVWSDIDFGEMILEVTSKESTDETWEWKIKDTDSRTLPLTEDVLKLLIALQDRRPAGYPYVMVPANRYDHIQRRRKRGDWSYDDARTSVINNFTKEFKKIRTKAGIKTGTFHDFRRTAITNWFYEGLSIIEVMRLAGHSQYDTTLKYYLAVKDDLVDKARKAVKHRVSREMLERCLGKGM